MTNRAPAFGATISILLFGAAAMAQPAAMPS